MTLSEKFFRSIKVFRKRVLHFRNVKITFNA